MSKQLGKQARILLALYRGQRLHRFQAEVVGDHTLNSTISTLANRYGLLFERARMKVPTRFGRPVSVIEYGLAASSREAAERLLAMWGALPREVAHG